MPRSPKPARPPSEAELKVTVLTHLLETGRVSRSAILASELPIGIRSTRVDLALLDDMFIGVEIKSNLDSLRRLEKQLAVYQQCFDLVLLVVGDKHEKNALTLQAPNLELWTAKGWDLCVARPAPAPTHNHSNSELAKRFRYRFTPTSEKFWAAVRGRRKIKTDDLRILSRYSERRELMAQLSHEQATQWQLWGEFLQRQSTHSSSVS